MAGNILALTSISSAGGVALHGRALARNGAVTLIDDTITAAHCATGAGGSAPASELDVAAALPADPGIGANQHLWPNRAVEAALVRGPPRPHARQLEQGDMGLERLGQGHLGQGHLGQGHLGGRTQRRGAVGARHLERAHMPGERPRAAVGGSQISDTRLKSSSARPMHSRWAFARQPDG